MFMKKISIIGTVGLPANYGGFETLSENLTKYLSNNFDISVYCSSKKYTNRIKKHNNAKLIYLPLQANGSQSIIYDAISIIHALFTSKTLLILGVSGCIILPFIKWHAKLTNKKIIINIDGLEWQRDKFSKFAKWFLKFSEKLAVKYADVIICDNKAIQDYVKQEYNKDSALIEYGGDNAKTVPIQDMQLQEYSFLKDNYAFSVCRIEPENNIHIILEAFNNQKDLPLVIVGNWLNNEYGSQLHSKYHNGKNIILLQPIYQKETLNLLRSNCYLYIHGHSAGGTNPSLVEAMFSNLPIIAFDVIYNRQTTENKALYFSNSFELLEIVKSNNDNDIVKMKSDLKEIADRRYLWQIIAQKYQALF